MIEREATRRFAELEKAMRDAGLDHLAEEFETHRPRGARAVRGAIRRHRRARAARGAGWEFDSLLPGDPRGWKPRKPRSAREALGLALATERRAQNFYSDVAESSRNDALSAFAAEMAADEERHIQRLEQLLARRAAAA